MNITVTGRLRSPVEFRRTPTGAAVVLLHIDVPDPRGVPVVARVWYGTGPAADYAAQQAAERWARGDSVTVVGSFVRCRTDHAFQAVILDGDVRVTTA